jgi:putative phosphonate metabolism protein
MGRNMANWRRHAIYFAPPAESALGRFGAAWLGWDPETGVAVDGLEVAGLPLPRKALVEAPRRYGFHATLKPPFRLAEGCDAAGLDAAVAALVAEAAPFPLRLRVGWLGGFLALVPEDAPPELAALERACVTGLDGFRAPPGAEELARRRAAGLDAVEEANLRRWGYPYVLDRFRFHMTLTGPVATDRRAAVEAALVPVVAPVVADTMPVADICWFAEAEDRRFRLVSRYRLGREARAGRARHAAAPDR